MTELQVVEPANLLAIYDLSFDGQRDAQCVREAKDCRVLADAFQDLPDQGECCRLYIIGDSTRRENGRFEDHLRKTVPLYNSSSSRGFDSLSTQWAKTKPSLHHALDLFTKETGHMRLGPQLKPESFTCSIGCYRAVNKALVIVIRLVVYERSDAASRHIDESLLNREPKHRRREIFDQYVKVFLEENQEHRLCQHTDHIPELRFKVYLLQFYRTALKLYEGFSEQASAYHQIDYLRYIGSSSPTYLWAKTVESASCTNNYLEKATSMSIMAKSLVSLVRETCTEQDLTPEIKCLLAEVVSLSDNITSPYTELANFFARQMDLMNTSRNIQDSRDSRLLNLLACIFLPASLATSLLSMSTRFIDLGPLLYDFCGVIVLFASFLALVFLSLQVYDKIKKKTATWKYRRWQRYDILWKMLLLALLVIVWPMVLSSFVVGMVVDVSLGSRILGYGAAAMVGAMLVLLGLGRIGYMLAKKAKAEGEEALDTDDS